MQELIHPIEGIGWNVSESFIWYQIAPSHSEFLLDLIPLVDNFFQTPNFVSDQVKTDFHFAFELSTDSQAHISQELPISLFSMGYKNICGQQVESDSST